MEYRNTKTGVVITVNSEIKGGDWEPILAPKSTLKKEDNLETPKKTAKRTK